MLSFSLTWYGLNRRCLDGQTAGYYWRDPWISNTTESVDTVIYFEGGGWCYGLNEQGTIDDCASKRKRWGSGRTKRIPWYLQHLGKDRNFVFVPNCDWTSLTGTAGEVPVNTSDGIQKSLYFEGFDILNDTINSIEPYIVPTENETARTPLVIVSGGSAGGSAVYYHADFIQETLPQAKIVALPDAAFFLDLPALNGTNVWPTQMKQIATLAQSRLHAACTFDPSAPRCLFPQYFVQLTTVPFFLLNSLYDTSELWYTLYLSCYTLPHDTCPRDEVAAFCNLGVQHQLEWQKLLDKNTTGAFVTNLLRHSQMGTHHMIQNTTLHDAFNAWLGGEHVRLVDEPLSQCDNNEQSHTVSILPQLEERL